MTRLLTRPRPRSRARFGSRRRARLSSGEKNVLVVVAIVVALLLGGKLIDPTMDPAGSGPGGAAVPFRGGSSDCSVDDPTTKSGCLTPATAHGLAEIQRAFGPVRGGPAITSAGCWDAHVWNPTSDHPKGRACDLFFGKAGAFPTGAPLDRGWAVAKWLRANAAALRVKYVIWQGRIWQADDDRDSGGWGKRYRGGGIYDPTDATGGHFDHVHVSFTT